MKYGVNTMVWTTRVDDRLSPLFVEIQKWGFDGVELFLCLTSLPIRRLSKMHCRPPDYRSLPAAYCLATRT